MNIGINFQKFDREPSPGSTIFFFPTCQPQSHFPSFISASGNFHQNFSKVSFIVAIYCAQVSFVADVYGAVTFEKCD